MRLKGTTPPLDPQLRQLLVDGPWSVGKTLRDLPPHDELRAAWQRHGAAILATLPPRVVPWFVERDRFVAELRGAAR
jgi:hypothetical protein